jgi:hypothetical protein
MSKKELDEDQIDIFANAIEDLWTGGDPHNAMELWNRGRS